jgi:hypothetical protein
MRTRPGKGEPAVTSMMTWLEALAAALRNQGRVV